MIVYGLNAVREALRAGRVERISVSARQLGLAEWPAKPTPIAQGSNDAGALAPGNPRLQELLAAALAQRVPFEPVDPRALDRAARGGAHQGVMAVVRAPDVWTPSELVRQAEGVPLIVVLDSIEDPHNLGAILRTADAVGASGLVRQARHAAPLEGVVAKTSSGAVAHARIATVVNIARAIEELKEQGVWTVGLDERGERAYDAIDMTVPTAIVLGAEGTGLRRLVRERCDWTASIPMRGQVSSLNVSVAAGVVLFEAARQRRAARK
jgi:23S rRNA (guanosine2251-2'-O)-methyltransferase